MNETFENCCVDGYQIRRLLTKTLASKELEQSLRVNRILSTYSSVSKMVLAAQPHRRPLATQIQLNRRNYTPSTILF